MINRMETAQYYSHLCRDTTPIMETQRDMKMVNRMETERRRSITHIYVGILRQ